jgi:hypothetical protein
VTAHTKNAACPSNCGQGHRGATGFGGSYSMSRLGSLSSVRRYIIPGPRRNAGLTPEFTRGQRNEMLADVSTTKICGRHFSDQLSAEHRSSRTSTARSGNPVRRIYFGARAVVLRSNVPFESGTSCGFDRVCAPDVLVTNAPWARLDRLKSTMGVLLRGSMGPNEEVRFL